jgi:hypothetical protein
MYQNLHQMVSATSETLFSKILMPHDDPFDVAV